MNESPRRRGARLRAIVLLALPLAACNDGDEGLDPSFRAPETGSYEYDALVHTSDTLPPDTLTGQLEISVASRDSIIGTWSVPGYTGASVRGVWNVNAYTLPANPTSIQGSVTHRVWRQSGTLDLSCALSYERVDMPADTFTSSTVNRCTLAR
jgi:hypothetical protein